MKIKACYGIKFAVNEKVIEISFEFKNGKFYTFQKVANSDWCLPFPGIELDENDCLSLLEHIKENELKDSSEE